MFVLPNNSQQTFPIKRENQTCFRTSIGFHSKNRDDDSFENGLRKIWRLFKRHIQRTATGALRTCGFSAVFLSFKCRGVKTVKIHAYMCVYAQRQKYAFLTDSFRCANTWFCFINVTVVTGTCTVGELHNYPLMNAEMLFDTVCWLLRHSLCEEKVHLRVIIEVLHQHQNSCHYA